MVLADYVNSLERLLNSFAVVFGLEIGSCFFLQVFGLLVVRLSSGWQLDFFRLFGCGWRRLLGLLLGVRVWHAAHSWRHLAVLHHVLGHLSHSLHLLRAHVFHPLLSHAHLFWSEIHWDRNKNNVFSL